MNKRGVSKQRKEHEKLIKYLIDNRLISINTGTNELSKIFEPLPYNFENKFFIELDEPYWLDGKF